MAQTIKSKIRKLASQYNIDAIIDSAVQVRNEMLDEQAWNLMTTEQKTQWFYDQCNTYNLTTHQDHNRIIVDQLTDNKRAYFTAFLPTDNEPEFYFEIGGSYYDTNGGIWPTARGLKGKEKQISEVMRLHSIGQ